MGCPPGSSSRSSFDPVKIPVFALPWVLGFVTHAAYALPPQPTVVGADVTTVTLGGASETRVVPWADVSSTTVEPGNWDIRFTLPQTATSLYVPVCAGQKRVVVDQVPHVLPAGPVVLDLPPSSGDHKVVIEISVGSYEHRVTCSEPPRGGGRAGERSDGLIPLSFESPHAVAGGGHAVVFIPPGHDVARPGPVMVGLHPWNGSIWTYAAYDALLSAARAADVVLLFPSGLGNSLYTRAAEDEVLRALLALESSVRVDPARITLWGASMGGAGATTIGLHHPDRFATVISFFGDSKYDLSTYVHAILRDERAAHLVNALDIVDNARNLPVWLIHGEDDHVSPIQQSGMLARALGALRFSVTFDRVPHAGHDGRVVSLFASRIVDCAKRARRVDAPSRVTYWSVLPDHDEAYGVRFTRRAALADAFFDLEREGDTLHLRRALNIDSLILPRGAFGFAPTATPSVINDDPASQATSVSWDPVP
jgi:pimeloyl-ACP methyl ester carboxylesterase